MWQLDGAAGWLVELACGVGALLLRRAEVFHMHACAACAASAPLLSTSA